MFDNIKIHFAFSEGVTKLAKEESIDETAERCFNLLKNMLVRNALLLFSLSLVSGQAIADNYFGESPTSTLTLIFGTDAVGSKDQTLYFDHELRSANHIQFGAGSTSFDASIKNSTFYTLGFSGDPLSSLYFGLNYQFDEREEKLLFGNSILALTLTRDTASGFVTWQPGDWSLSLQPQLSNILIQTANIDANRGIRNPGIRLSVGYFGFEKFSFFLNHSESSYSNNIDLLIEIAQRTGQFDESRSAAAVDFHLNNVSVGLEWQRNVAIDSIDIYDVWLINASLNLSESWSFQGQIGTPVGGSINTEGFGNLGFNFRW